MTEHSTESKNTDRELWREREGDYYAPALFVTEGGGIGMDVGGHVIVMPIRSWHKLAAAKGWDDLIALDKGKRIEAPEGYVGPPLPPRFPSDRMG